MLITIKTITAIVSKRKDKKINRKEQNLKAEDLRHRVLLLIVSSERDMKLIMITNILGSHLKY